MIARVWRGYTKRDDADTYEAMLKPELLPGLGQVAGYRGSYLLRRPVGEEVEFVTIILWDSLDAIRAVAGPDVEKAVIPRIGDAICPDMTRSRRIMRLLPCTAPLRRWQGNADVAGLRSAARVVSRGVGLRSAARVVSRGQSVNSID